jgi:hypothetical protein
MCFCILQVDTDDEAATLMPLQNEMQALAERYAASVRSHLVHSETFTV